ncbi:hypothetical protein ACHAWF_017996, partial [Thalassiosira exigua]
RLGRGLGRGLGGWLGRGLRRGLGRGLGRGLRGVAVVLVLAFSVLEVLLAALGQGAVLGHVSVGAIVGAVVGVGVEPPLGAVSAPSGRGRGIGHRHLAPTDGGGRPPDLRRVPAPGGGGPAPGAPGFAVVAALLAQPAVAAFLARISALLSGVSSLLA